MKYIKSRMPDTQVLFLLMFNALSFAIEYLLNTLSIRFDGTPKQIAFRGGG